MIKFDNVSLRTARKNAGLSQYRTSQLINIKQPIISLHETGKYTPSATQLAYYANAYNVTVNDFFSEVEEETA